MSQYNNQGHGNQPSSDEIDLREVFAAVGRFFASIGRGIVNFILMVRRATIRFRMLILCCAVIGGVAGFLFKKYEQDYFEARMVIDSKYYSYDLLKSLTEKMDRLAAEGNEKGLAQMLNVPEVQVANLRKIAVEPVMPTEEKANLRAYLQLMKDNIKDLKEEQLDSLQQRLMLNASQYAITIQLYDNTALPQLQEGIVGYLAANPYITRRSQVEKQNLQMLKGNLETDEQKLSRLKDLLAENYSKFAESNQQASNNVFFGPDGSSDPMNVYKQSLEMQKQKARINRSLSLSDEVELVSGFVAFEQPASISLVASILLWIVLGIATAYLVIILLGLNSALNGYEKKQASKRQVA